MNENTDLFISDFRIKKHNLNYKDIINRNIVIYGRTGTGKSVILKDILYNLKDNIPLIIVITPTNQKEYSEFVPSSLIYNEVKQNLIETILDKQKQGTEIYNQVNNINVLYNLFNKYSNINEKSKYQQYINSYNDAKSSIMNNNDNNNLKKSKLDKLESIHNNTLIDLFKNIIYNNKNNIQSNKIDEEIQILKYIHYNPKIILVLDDCAHSISKWGKFNEMNEIFFNGRHSHITTIITLQNDKLLPSALRENARINIFTTIESTTGFFINKTNSFTKEQIKQSQLISKKIFNTEDGKENFKKLIYFTEKSFDDRFQYLLADLHYNFKFGDRNLWEYHEKVQKKNKKHSDKFNKFNNLF